MSALFQFAAQFQVIVNLAVEDNDGVAILGYDGLIAALDVDDLQPRRAQRDGLGFKDALAGSDRDERSWQPRSGCGLALRRGVRA